MFEEMELRKVPLSQMNPAKYNPRKDLQPGDPEYDKLLRSIQTYGYVDPIIWNQRTGNIVGGHQRFKILKQMGAAELQVVVVDLDPVREKGLNVALNKIGGEFEMELLSQLLYDLREEDFDVTLTGYDLAEVEEIIEAQVRAKRGEEEEFDAEAEAAAIETPITQPGDVWLLGHYA